MRSIIHLIIKLFNYNIIRKVIKCNYILLYSICMHISMYKFSNKILLYYLSLLNYADYISNKTTNVDANCSNTVRDRKN